VNVPDLRSILWGQLGATLDMLENAVDACPEDVWSDGSRPPPFWYLAFHTLFFLDFYLSESETAFAPPAAFTLTELDPAGVMPERVYTKAELRDYLAHGRAKARGAIAALTGERAAARRRFGSVEGTGIELFLYGMRHVQHHAAQLNLILRQRTDSAPNWVGRTKIGL